MPRCRPAATIGLVLLAALALTGCRSLAIEGHDSRPARMAKIGGRTGLGFLSGGASELYYAGRRSR